MSEEAVSCVQPAAGPLLSGPSPSEAASEPQPIDKEVEMSFARVGHEAPDFEAAAYVDGGSKNIVADAQKVAMPTNWANNELVGNRVIVPPGLKVPLHRCPEKEQ